MNSIGYDVLGSAYEVKKRLGKTLLERVYEYALGYELECRGHKIEHQVLVPIVYKGVEIDSAYRADIVVDDSVIIEVKARRITLPEDLRQLQTYLSFGKCELGYVLNFGAEDFSVGRNNSFDGDYGIYRVINTK